MLTRRTLLATLLASPALAQASFPTRPIKIIVPYVAGGVNDFAVRLLANKLNETLGTIVIENIGGGGTSIGALAAARSPADGYTLLFGGQASLTIAPQLMAKDKYDAFTDFEHIGLMALTATCVVINPKLPINSLQELTAYIKNNAGKLSYSSPGLGSPGHLAGELYKSIINEPTLTHIAYRGAAPALSDVIAGHLPMTFPSMNGGLIEQHKAGNIKILAVNSSNRLNLLPEVPTAAQAGIANLISQSYVGLFAPKGTPLPILETLNKALVKVMDDKTFQLELSNAGLEPVLNSTPEKTKSYVREDIARWQPLLKTLDLK
jgi:tripartite-type tricarboxylate transporter receptor subunit TctC